MPPTPPTFPSEPRDRTAAPHRRSRRGSAIAESLVAAVVLSVGVLATAGAIGGAVRQEGAGALRRRAGALLAERAERVRSAPCAADGGARTVDGLVERWRADLSDGTLVLRDSVLLPGPRRGAVALVVVRECAP